MDLSDEGFGRYLTMAGHFKEVCASASRLIYGPDVDLDGWGEEFFPRLEYDELMKQLREENTVAKRRVENVESELRKAHDSLSAMSIRVDLFVNACCLIDHLATGLRKIKPLLC